ncbi:hypothetical protein RGQ29_004925 [Quercus rubra]|uniref:Uncharacterized protein n=1 Tax=Quercus rubra TaxID=3512 RepID=A0AAN7I9X9_QUERU|nr:hypothetical protein RGQ29_004925 [Quercus rubra]
MQTVMKRILSNGFPSTSSSWRRQFDTIRSCRRQFDLISSWRPWRRPFNMIRS